jgi:hypothetical protein
MDNEEIYIYFINRNKLTVLGSVLSIYEYV